MPVRQKGAHTVPDAREIRLPANGKDNTVGGREERRKGEKKKKEEGAPRLAREIRTPGQRNNAHNYSPSLYHLSYHE